MAEMPSERRARRWTWPTLARPEALPSSPAAPAAPGPGMAARWLREALDHTADAVLLLGRQGELHFANAAARRLREQHRLFAVREGRIALGRFEDQPRLLGALAALDGHATTTLPLHDPRGHVCGIIHLTPLTGATQAPPGPHAIAIVRVMDALEPETARALWGLTAEEAELAGWLLDGLTPRQVMQLHRLDGNALRARLRGLFAKTGTHHRTQLMRLLQAGQG